MASEPSTQFRAPHLRMAFDLTDCARSALDDAVGTDVKPDERRALVAVARVHLQNALDHVNQFEAA